MSIVQQPDVKIYPQPNGQVQVSATFMDDETNETFVREFMTAATTKPEEIDALLRQARTELLGLLDLRGAFPGGVRDIDLSAPEVKDETPEEKARRIFKEQKAQLAEMVKEIDLKVRKPDDPKYLALLAIVEKAVDDGAADVATAELGVKP